MTRVERWERRSEIPLILLALAFLVAYAWPVLDPRLDTNVRSFLTVVSWTVWMAFALDFAARLVLADDRRRYAASHWYDVALIVLPMLRPLRLLRLLALARVLGRASTSLAARRPIALALAISGVACATLAAIDVSISRWRLAEGSSESPTGSSCA